MAYYPLLVRVNGNINEEDAIATGERIITLEEAPVDSETNEVVKEPFAAVQTLYYGENKYGYSDDVKGRKGKLGPGTPIPTWSWKPSRCGGARRNPKAACPCASRTSSASPPRTRAAKS